MKKNSLAFSLIEMLIVITVFALLAYFVTQSTLQSFVGTRKADAQSKVRDNLNYAAEVVERNLRNAKTITYPTTCSGTVSYINYTDLYDRPGSFNCVTDYLASGSAGLRVTSTDIVLTACSFTCSKANSSVSSPPIIDLQLVGRGNTTAATEQSLTAISRRIVLRVY